MKTSQNLGRESRKTLEIHPLNSERWVGDLEVEFVTTFLGDLPGLSCRATQINFKHLSNPKVTLVQ